MVEFDVRVGMKIKRNDVPGSDPAAVGFDNLQGWVLEITSIENGHSVMCAVINKTARNATGHAVGDSIGLPRKWLIADYFDEVYIRADVSGKIPYDQTVRFDRDEFYGLRYLPDNGRAGFGVLEIHVDGRHPEKIVDVAVRMYHVQSGCGAFVVDGAHFNADVGDLFVVYEGSTYSYEGTMKLLEINAPKRS